MHRRYERLDASRTQMRLRAGPGVEAVAQRERQAQSVALQFVLHFVVSIASRMTWFERIECAMCVTLQVLMRC
jgi:hypothetical protein